MTKQTVVLTTCETQEQARKIAHKLVESRLAACVQIVPEVESIYRWKEEVKTSAEVLLLIKTRGDLVPELTRTLESIHPYELPEVVCLPIDQGLARYLDWIDEETNP